MHVAALQQGGLAWPCPAWLRPPDNQHEAAPPGNSALITPNKSSAAVNALGREQAVNYISTDDVISQDDASDTSSSTSDDAGVDSVAKIVHEQSTAPVSLAQMPSSLNKAISSGTSEESSNSSDGHDASNSNSSSSASDASSSSSDTEQGPVGQQAAFRQLDSLFASSAASGAVFTHLAALDLLKRVPAVKARPGSSTGMSGLTAGRLSAAQSGVKLRKQGHQPQQQQQNQQQEREQQQQQQQQRLSRANKGSKPRAETRAARGKGSSRKGAGLADAKGGKEPHKAEWVQMQDGGNPLYLQQKHGLPGEGEQAHACSRAFCHASQLYMHVRMMFMPSYMRCRSIVLLLDSSHLHSSECLMVPCSHVELAKPVFGTALIRTTMPLPLSALLQAADLKYHIISVLLMWLTTHL